MSAFERLSPALQYQIVNTLSFRELRPVQLDCIDALLDGKNAVVLAPTAGGKTEAAFFPLLSLMESENWRPVSVLYLSPIRALLNNQEPRIARYAGTLGRRVFKWHGDTSESERRRFLREPTEILLITPESLEAMMMSTRVSAEALFHQLRAVVIDEVHAFADDDRGAHLSALMERLASFTGNDIQRVGLSATVGNPEEILDWLQGSSTRSGIVVNPGGSRQEPELSLDYVGNIENAAQVIRQLHPGRKRLVFVDSRRQAEGLGNVLQGLGVLTYVTHGSLSVTERRDAERAFQEGQDCVIVATSALELGIDVGDLDHVLQLDSPPSVASFLQRMGRTGRRGGPANCTFLATKDSSLIQAAAIIHLFRQGFVEPVRAHTRAFHILAHQLMAQSVDRGGIGRDQWWSPIKGARAFSRITDSERAALVEHMLAAQLLSDQEGRLWLGPDGERYFGRANFRELYAVFDTPRLITVQAGGQEIGTVDASFLAAVDSELERGAFVLAGRAWQIVAVEWARGLCVVKPTQEGRAPRWHGSPRFLSYELCQSMRTLLVGTVDDPAWSQRARRVLEASRAEHAFLAEQDSPFLTNRDEITWWNYAGGAANLLLARMLESSLGGQAVSRNTSITFKQNAAKSLTAILDWLRELAERGGPSPADAAPFALGSARSRISKFDRCLPEEQLSQLVVETVFDLEGARKAVVSAGSRPTR